MKVIEKMGLSFEAFGKLYDENDGFDSRINRNHPVHEKNENVYDFIMSGADDLVNNKRDVIDEISI